MKGHSLLQVALTRWVVEKQDNYVDFEGRAWQVVTMQFEDEFEATPSSLAIKGGMKDLADRIREVPKRAVLRSPAEAPDVTEDYARAAQCLNGVESGLDVLWPND